MSTCFNPLSSLCSIPFMWSKTTKYFILSPHHHKRVLFVIAISPKLLQTKSLELRAVQKIKCLLFFGKQCFNSRTFLFVLQLEIVLVVQNIDIVNCLLKLFKHLGTKLPFSLYTFYVLEVIFVLSVLYIEIHRVHELSSQLFLLILANNRHKFSFERIQSLALTPFYKFLPLIRQFLDCSIVNILDVLKSLLKLLIYNNPFCTDSFYNVRPFSVYAIVVLLACTLTLLFRTDKWKLITTFAYTDHLSLTVFEALDLRDFENTIIQLLHVHSLYIYFLYNRF